MRKKLRIILVLGTTVAIGSLFLGDVLAGTGQIYLSPSSTSVNKGSSIVFSLRISPGTNVDGVETTLSYDTAKLQYSSISSSGSAFPIQLAQSGGSGTVQIDRGNLSGGVTASGSLIAKVTFKALVGSGSTSVQLSGNATHSGTYTDPSTPDATVNFATATSSNDESDPKTDTPTSGGSGTSGSGTANNTSGGALSKPPKKTADKAEVKTKASDVQFTIAKISVTSTIPVKAHLKYGVGDQLNISTKETKYATKHTLSMDSKLLVPGTTYSYVIVYKDKSGKETKTEKQTIKTAGYEVRVALLGKNNELLANKEVTLFSEPVRAKTDKEGIAVFKNVAPGEHTIEYAVGDEKYSQPIQVANDVISAGGKQVAAVQNFSVVFSDANTTQLSASTVMLVLAALGIAAFFILRRNKLVAQTSAGMHHIAPSGSQPKQDDALPETQAKTNTVQHGPGHTNGPAPGHVINPTTKDTGDE